LGKISWKKGQLCFVAMIEFQVFQVEAHMNLWASQLVCLLSWLHVEWLHEECPCCPLVETSWKKCQLHFVAMIEFQVVQVEAHMKLWVCQLV